MNRFFKVCTIGLLAAVLVVPVFAGGGQQAGGAQGDVIKIGVYEPLTGANAAGGAVEVEGLRLANEHFPTVDVGGKTYKVELVIADHKSDKVEAANVVERLISVDKVNAIIGTWGSGFAMAGGEIIKDKGIPALGTSCTNPLVTAGNDWYFRVCFIDPFQGTVMANFAYNELKARKAVIIQEINNEYSVGLAKFFVDAFRKLTGDPNAILATVNYNTGDQEFSAQLTTVRDLKPDVIFAPGNYTESALIIRQGKELGITAPFIGGDTWDIQEFIDVGKDSVEWIMFSTFFVPTLETASTPLAKKFLEDYEARYHKPAAGYTVNGYDAYLVMLDAFKRAGSLDPAKVRDALASTKGFVGVTGSITLDENGDAIKGAQISIVKDGKFVFKSFVEP